MEKVRTEISDIAAAILVNKPVLMVKRMRRLMIVSERRKPVRERWRRNISVAAMPTSDATPSMLIDRDSFTIVEISTNVLKWMLESLRSGKGKEEVSSHSIESRKHISLGTYAFPT